MNYFIVYAHYEPKSFCHALLDQTITSLESLGHIVQLSDLYAMKFNPIASQDDFRAPNKPDYCQYALEQRHGYTNQTLAPDILAEVEKLLWADVVIFHFPLFWFAMPAIMKGWIDRVFLSGLCYGGRRFYKNGGLAPRRASLSVTMGSRDTMFDNGANIGGAHNGLAENVVHPPLDTFLSPIIRGTIGYVGMDYLPAFYAYHVPYISDDARVEILQKCHDHYQAQSQYLGQLIS